MKSVAIVHDWLNGMRGGEKVLEALLELYPHATIYTLFHERGKVSSFIESHPIVTSWLDRLPGVYRHYRNLLPLFPSAIESWDLSNYDVVISSSHAVAKGARTGSALHICYCHTPMRYVWDAEDDYEMSWPQRTAFRFVRPGIQRWDCEASNRVDSFIANSRFISERIRLYYGRQAEVIHPPVDTQFFSPSTAVAREDFYLAAGALVPYKRFDIVVKAFNSVGRPLVIVGPGPELKRLRAMAGSSVALRGWVPSDELRRLYRSAKALVFAGREDFGMVAVEAQCCGCPVIALGAGGSTETIQDGVNGVLFAEQHAEDLLRAVRRFETKIWPVDRIRSRVENFSRETFKTRIRKFIEDRAQERQGRRALALHTA